MSLQNFMKIKDYGNETLQFDVDKLVCHLEQLTWKMSFNFDKCKLIAMGAGNNTN